MGETKDEWWTLPWLRADFNIGRDFSLKIPGLWVLLFLFVLSGLGGFAIFSGLLVHLADSEHRAQNAEMVSKYAAIVSENAHLVAKLEAEQANKSRAAPELSAKQVVVTKPDKTSSVLKIDRREPPIRQGGARIERFQP